MQNDFESWLSCFSLFRLRILSRGVRTIIQQPHFTPTLAASSMSAPLPRSILLLWLAVVTIQSGHFGAPRIAKNHIPHLIACTGEHPYSPSSSLWCFCGWYFVRLFWILSKLQAVIHHWHASVHSGFFCWPFLISTISITSSGVSLRDSTRSLLNHSCLMIISISRGQSVNKQCGMVMSSVDDKICFAGYTGP